MSKKPIFRITKNYLRRAQSESQYRLNGKKIYRKNFGAGKVTKKRIEQALANMPHTVRMAGKRGNWVMPDKEDGFEEKMLQHKMFVKEREVEEYSKWLENGQPIFPLPDWFYSHEPRLRSSVKLSWRKFNESVGNSNYPEATIESFLEECKNHGEWWNSDFFNIFSEKDYNVAKVTVEATKKIEEEIVKAKEMMRVVQEEHKMMEVEKYMPYFQECKSDECRDFNKRVREGIGKKENPEWKTELFFKLRILGLQDRAKWMKSPIINSEKYPYYKYPLNTQCTECPKWSPETDKDFEKQILKTCRGCGRYWWPGSCAHCKRKDGLEKKEVERKPCIGCGGEKKYHPTALKTHLKYSCPNKHVLYRLGLMTAREEREWESRIVRCRAPDCDRRVLKINLKKHMKRCSHIRKSVQIIEDCGSCGKPVLPDEYHACGGAIPKRLTGAVLTCEIQGCGKEVLFEQYGAHVKAHEAELLKFRKGFQKPKKSRVIQRTRTREGVYVLKEKKCRGLVLTETKFLPNKKIVRVQCPNCKRVVQQETIDRGRHKCDDFEPRLKQEIEKYMGVKRSYEQALRNYKLAHFRWESKPEYKERFREPRKPKNRIMFSIRPQGLMTENGRKRLEKQRGVDLINKIPEIISGGGEKEDCCSKNGDSVSGLSGAPTERQSAVTI